jgi:hypothetical protein
MHQCVLTDDLHRTWLSWEMFTDIGIVDPKPTIAAESEEAATVSAVEEITMQFIGIIGTSHGKSSPHTPSPLPLPTPICVIVPAPCHRATPVSDCSLVRHFCFGLVWFRAARMLGFRPLTTTAELSNRKDFLLHSWFSF